MIQKTMILRGMGSKATIFFFLHCFTVKASKYIQMAPTFPKRLERVSGVSLATLYTP